MKSQQRIHDFHFSIFILFPSFHTNETTIIFEEFQLKLNLRFSFGTYRIAKISNKHAIVGIMMNRASITMVCISFQSENRIQIIN